VSIILKGRQGKVTPLRDCHTHTGAGYIDVAQPSPDTVVITMTGVAVAYGGCGSDAHAGMDFNLEQCFEVSFDKEDLKKAKISIEGRVIGLLRSPCPCLNKAGCGMAEESHACARIVAAGAAGPGELLGLCLPDHAVSCDNLSINDHDGPVEAPVVAGKYVLQQTFHVSAQHPKSYLPCKADSAEFAPDPALDPLWISYWEPFHGVSKKDLGFQITIKVAEDTSKSNGDKKEEEKKDEKKEEKKDEKKAGEPVGAPAPVGAGTPMAPGALVPAAPVSLPSSVQQ
jgi:hypothetical protein